MLSGALNRSDEPERQKQRAQVDQVVDEKPREQQAEASDRLVLISDETTGMFASMDDPQAFLLHDIAFHRAVASACDNPILSSLVDMVSELFRQHRRQTIGRAHDLKDAAEEHRRIYLAVRARDAERARRAMRDHLDRAYRTQAIEENDRRPGGREPDGPAARPKLTTP